MKRLVALGLVLPIVGAFGARTMVAARGAAPLVVHEWGTITTRHAPDGTPEGRLNRINPREVLPTFVHRFEPPSPPAAPSSSANNGSLVKSPVTPGRAEVTMRLETPVLYFYPAAGSPASALPAIDVSVRFRGGVLNEFYPRADASVGVDFDPSDTKAQSGTLTPWNGELLDRYVAGSLRWNGVTLQDNVALPQTSSPIWLAPRNVRSTSVLTTSGEGERYLFYRGVAHLDALVQTTLSTDTLVLRAPRRLDWMSEPAMTIPGLWLVDVRADGSAAFRKHRAFVIAKNAPWAELATMPLFASSDYTGHCLDDLRASMKQALETSGLFSDEAEAMLRTWNESYFRTPGLRLFYIVPREWIDYHLPLTLSPPAAVTRVLVGRVDLLR